MVRCVEAGRGEKGSVYLCKTCRGDVEVRAVKVFNSWHLTAYVEGGPLTLMVPGVHRRGQTFTRMIEEWLELATGCGGGDGED